MTDIMTSQNTDLSSWDILYTQQYLLMMSSNLALNM